MKLADTFRSSDSTFDLVVQARDGGGLTSTSNSIVQVTVADPSQARPTFTEQLYEFSVNEDEAENSPVGTVEAQLSGSK